jgi:uncharacterized protein
MRFEWDENKRLINLQRHGIDFADVFLIFSNPLVSHVDDRFDYSEIRFLTFALLFGDVIVVAHTEDDETFRVISARKAEKYEQEIYFNSIRN